MVKIKFETGQTVNFDGTPTQRDINEISARLKPATEAPQPEGVRGPAGVAVGLGKSAAGLAAGVGQLAQATGQRVLSALPGISLEQVRARTGVPALQRGAPEQQQLEERLRARGGAEKFGKVAGDIAQFAVPAGAIARGARAAQAVTAGRIGERTGRAARLGTEAVGFGGIETLRQGRVTPGAVATGVVGAGAAPVLRAAGGAIGRAVARRVPEGRVPEALRGARERAVLPTEKETARISEIIGPKLTSREVQKAVAEGRVARGKRVLPSVFGKKPDVVTQSRQIQQATDTIQRRIPGAAKLDDLQLDKRLQGEITSTAQGLESQLKAVPAPAQIVQKAGSTWKRLKRTQAREPEFEAFAGAKRAQKNFEVFLDEASKPIQGAKGRFRFKNLDDLWKIRIKYDKSISPAVKKADDRSTPSTILQKEMWLSNRAILNDLINQTARRLDVNSRKSFSELSDLYAARTNIASKVKIEKAKPGFFTKNKLLALGALFVGGNVIERTTGVNIPGI